MASFPKNFLWGAGDSAYQVEGNNHNDWTEWEKLGYARDGGASGLATGRYTRYKEDFALAKRLGHNTSRFSIEWSRIMPKPGVIDEHELEHYREVVQECRRLGLEPFVTLWHFTNPIWIAKLGGWRSRQTVDWFAKYVDAVVQTLGDSVRYWITINEPTVYSSLGYLCDIWPPMARNPALAWLAIRNLLKAHKMAAQIIHRAIPGARVGTANNLSDFVPARPSHPLDRLLVLLAKYWHNQWWLDATHDSVDFIGLNFYLYYPLKFKLNNWRNWFAPEHPVNRQTTDLGWPIAPDAFGRLLHWLRRYDRPIYITENGLADAEDRQRAQFIIDHVREIERAISDGVDIRGYIYWSLTDNFEVGMGFTPRFGEVGMGFTPRFGLVAIDYHDLSRHIRPSAEIYKKIIERNGADL